jgi:protein involved in sex pheromone biosynthesis
MKKFILGALALAFVLSSCEEPKDNKKNSTTDSSKKKEYRYRDPSERSDRQEKKW